MNQHSDFDRVLSRWFDDGPVTMPDRVVGVVAGRIGGQPQRRGWRLFWRQHPMNGYTKLVAAAVAGLALVLVGSVALPRLMDQFGRARPFGEIIARYDNVTLGLVHPVDLAVAPNGDIYVTESNDRVTEITPSGHIVRQWGTPGSAPGQFDFNGLQAANGAYASIAVAPDGRVYVADSDNHRVQVFEADGTFVRQFGSAGSGQGQFGLAYDLAVDASGNAYVLDDMLEHLTKFSPTGEVIWIANRSTNPALVGHGHGVTLDPRGRLVYGNDDNGKVIYLDTNGRFLDAFDAGACDASVDGAGNVYIGGCASADIKVFDTAHTLIGTWTGALLRDAPAFGPAGEVFGFDRDGNILRLQFNLTAG